MWIFQFTISRGWFPRIIRQSICMYRRETRNVSGLSLRPTLHIYFRNERRAWLAARVCRTRSLSCSSRVFLLRLLPRLILMDLSGRWYARRKCYCLAFFFFCSHDPAAANNMSYHPKKKLPGFDYCQLLGISSKYRWESEQSLHIILYSTLIGQWHMIPIFL
jgi:hypothetical protein